MNVSAFCAGRILCVADDLGSRQTRCAVLELSGYHCVSASLRFAEILLLYQSFDLLVVSGLPDDRVRTLSALARGAESIILEWPTKPETLLAMVAERLQGANLGGYARFKSIA